jgi:hypothetical protein
MIRITIYLIPHILTCLLLYMPLNIWFNNHISSMSFLVIFDLSYYGAYGFSTYYFYYGFLGGGGLASSSESSSELSLSSDSELDDSSLFTNIILSPGPSIPPSSKFLHYKHSTSGISFKFFNYFISSGKYLYTTSHFSS